MVVMRSLVFGNICSDESEPLCRMRPSQEFVRDEILIYPSIDRRAEISHANRVVSSGKSLALDAAERAMAERR